MAPTSSSVILSSKTSASSPRPFQLEDVSCQACASDARTFYQTLSGFEFHRCGSCGLVYMSPRPTAESLETLYDEHYFASADPNVGYAVYEADRDSVRDKSERLLSGIESHSSNARGALLDIGSAHGYLLEVAKEHGWQVTGVEPAASVAARTAGRLGCTVHRDLFEAGLDENTFDIVTAWDVVEHLPELTRVVREIHRVGKPGSLLSIVTPDVGSLAARVLGTRWEEMRKMPEHIYFFNRKSLARFLDRHGFDILEWGTVGKLMDVDEAAARVAASLPRVLRPLSRIAHGIGLASKRFYLDPRWKLSVLARQRA